MTSHDVRRMQVCCLCKKLGVYRPSNPDTAMGLVICVHPAAVPKRDRKYCHPRCYQKEMGLAKLLTIPRTELDAIRICDVSARTMRAILRKARQWPL